MNESREALTKAHDTFAKALDAFAKMVISTANNGKDVGDLKGIAVLAADEGAAVRRVIIRTGGSCGVYEDPPGTCRLCTPEEDQGEIFQTP
ncbi:MAG: hypothetical protein EOQ55_00720 [Mesorhizobium sp.]|uniref:hypothetical protein n=1 Tax=unclassified Mesorhizobium TaxID=325217 RepID=UPI000FCC6D8E|nr:MULTISPECIES: hypothetical protein [unclassified Mesorhizobium]RUV41071.1 hypothetical protein EOD29_25145 [Mesorhizobium sp. M1A.T.Ca.IN.004.03.1.1]RWG23312.1 MAG: hypothetical protein EOQ55_00720 [Mesorhizobium sp.]RWG60490.1 MAG: hypothetical protein EOQ64_01555 [Mesorhizobium sp.]RWH39489.1 MAG: hypothetical protein EOQ78_22150 [Mesorhizobium sp.]RWK30834.1 MAG: hypothetical protein EOR40_24705 [Mesorhizobium sp.]